MSDHPASPSRPPARPGEEAYDIRDLADVAEVMQKNPGMLAKGFLGLFLIAIMFFSGFSSFGFFLLGRMEQDFYEKAAEAEARVTDVQQEKRLETPAGPQHANNPPVVRYIYMVDLEFEVSGQTVRTRIADGESSVLRAGDRVEILYDPAYPRKVQLAGNGDNPLFLHYASKVAGGIFVVAAAIFFLLMMRRPRRA